MKKLLLERYNKIVRCIESVETEGQVNSCLNIIETFSNQSYLTVTVLHRDLVDQLYAFLCGKLFSINEESAKLRVESTLIRNE